jgi:hypothetical protein
MNHAAHDTHVLEAVEQAAWYCTSQTVLHSNIAFVGWITLAGKKHEH